MAACDGATDARQIISAIRLSEPWHVFECATGLCADCDGSGSVCSTGCVIDDECTRDDRTESTRPTSHEGARITAAAKTGRGPLAVGALPFSGFYGRVRVRSDRSVGRVAGRLFLERAMNGEISKEI